MRPKLSIIFVTVMIVSIAGAGLALASSSSPAAILSDLTGEPASALEEKNTEETYGAIAAELGVRDEFKAARIKQKMAIVDRKTSEGALSQEEAEELKGMFNSRAQDCTQDGFENSRRHLGKEYGISFGEEWGRKTLQRVQEGEQRGPGYGKNQK